MTRAGEWDLASGRRGRFGTCPFCHTDDGYLNVEAEQWIVCDEHRAKWRIGSDVFSDWRRESADVWERNRVQLAGYVEVTPYYWPATSRRSA